MNLFIQGMRRSGTTILYDALLEDPALRCFYEPFSHSGEARGGGSGARDQDLFAEVRELRERFRREHRPDLDTELLNWGAPRDAALEFEPDFPELPLAYLRFLLERAPDVVIKCVRLYCKVGALAELDSAAGLVHVVRDPRAVATAYIVGRGRKRADEYVEADRFFGQRSERKLWASRLLSERLIARPEHRHLADCPDYVRVLLVWRFTFEHTREAGERCFGERYRMLRHEDMCTDPGGALEEVYALLGRPLPAPVVAWAEANVRSAGTPYAPDDRRWEQGYADAGVEPALAAAGYR